MPRPAATESASDDKPLTKVVYLCGADWYFALHFLELARTVQAAGFEVHVIAGVGEREDFSAVFAEAGVHFHPIHLSRTGLTPFGRRTARGVRATGVNPGAAGPGAP